MKFIILRGEFSVYQFAVTHVPSIDFAAQDFVCVAKTSDEVSVVGRSGLLRGAQKVEEGWRTLKIEGPLDFGLVGILAEASSILAVAGISIFAVSTFDTDYLLLKSDRLDDAKAALERGGHSVVTAPGPAGIPRFRDRVVC